MRSALAFVAVLGAALSGCKAHHQALPARSTQLAGRLMQYPSGLRVVVEPDRGSKRVAVTLLVGSGSAQDPPGREGLAHLAEHVAFRARPGGRLSAWDELDFAGLASAGSPFVHAFTRADCTSFSGIAPADRAAAVLPLMASLVVRPLHGVDDATLEVERNVVRRERFDTDPLAGGAVGAALAASVLPPGFPGSRPLGGTDASIRAITRADLEAFVREHYLPANTIVVLAGDVLPGDVDRLVRASFPKEWLDADAPVRPRHREGAVDSRVPNPPMSTARRVVEARVPRRLLYLSWAVPGLAQPSGSAMPLVADALASELGSPKGVKRLDVMLVQGVHVSLLSLAAELEDGVLADEVRDRLKEMNRRGSFTVGEWQDLYVHQLDVEQSLVERSRSRALALFAWGIVKPLARGPDKGGIDSLKIVRKEVLDWSRAREVLVVPYVRTAAALDEDPTPAVEPPSRVTKVEPAALDAVALGPAVGETRTLQLDNGLHVVLSRRPAVPVATVALGLPARARHTTRDAAAFAGWLLRWDVEGAARFLDWPTVHVGGDSTVVAVSGLSVHLPLLLDVLGHNLPPRVSWFGADALNKAAEELKRRDAQNRDERRDRETDIERFDALVRQVLPPGTPALAPKLDELGGTERGWVVDLVDLAWRPDGAWLVVDGDIDLAPTEQVVRELFASWRPAGPAPAPPANPAPPARPVKPLVVEDQDAATTRVRLACRLPVAASVEAMGGIALLEHVLTAWFEDDLRRARGLTYGVQVSTTRWRHEDNLLSLQVTLDPANRQAALRRFLERLYALDGAVWEEQRVDAARWHVAKERIGTSLRPSSLAPELAGLGASGLPAAVVLDWPKVLAKAPLRAVDEAWMLCSDTWALELEGERSTIEAALRETPRP